MIVAFTISTGITVYLVFYNWYLIINNNKNNNNDNNNNNNNNDNDDNHNENKNLINVIIKNGHNKAKKY